MYHPFSVAETIKTAWHVLKKNFATISVYSLIVFLLVGVSCFITYIIVSDPVLTLIAFVVLLVEISFIFLGFIKLVLRLMDKEYYDFDIVDIIPNLRMLGSYLLLLVLMSTLTVFITSGLEHLPDGVTKDVLGIGTGALIQFFFLFYFPICTCFIVDDESGPFESVAQGFQLIKGNFFKYFLLFLLIELLIIIGSLTIIGMIIVIPFVNILLLVAYRKLVYSHQDVDDDIAETN
jgi:uncharacterized membrane protein